jgi:Zn-dependent peptidase ImmA (M78 family)
LKFLTYQQIEEAAGNFAKEHNPTGTIPVPVEEILEFGISLEVVTHKGLFQQHDIDAFLSSDLKQIHIDEDHYMGVPNRNRGRFTIAHEIGHYVLHKDIIRTVDTIENWKKLILGAGTGRDMYETQANDFAGCLLMPRDAVLKEYDDYKKVIEAEFKRNGFAFPDTTTVNSFVSKAIARKFDVSEQAAGIRVEKIMKTSR